MNIRVTYTTYRDSEPYADPNDYLEVKTFDDLVELLDQKYSNYNIDTTTNHKNALKLWNEIQKLKEVS